MNAKTVVARTFFIAILALAGSLSVRAQTAPAVPDLPTLPYFAAQQPDQPAIGRDVTVERPFSVLGPRGALLGQQDGTLEAWIFPWKILSHLRMSAQMKDYPVPIDINQQAAWIDVQPGHTTITFAHANFTIRETLFAPQHAPEGGGALGFFEIQAVRPLTLTLSFTPEMVRMWPAESEGPASPEWVKTGDSGFYALHTNRPDVAAAIAIPTAQYGILAPYQERPEKYPLQFLIHFDPAKDQNKLYPLLMTTGETEATANTQALAAKLQSLNAGLAQQYRETQEHFSKLLSSSLSIDTPDEKLNEAFRWAVLSIDQLRVETTPSHSETAMVAGFYSSGDSARPGFGWFFGRDSLWTLYAVNSYGDFALARDELNFLIKRQRDDGKIMHEWSQTADLVDWKGMPYGYASADATPLLLMASNDYLRLSGDREYISAHWDALQRAWNFESTHDTDGDGIYENTQGTAWVESWPPGMPHQELYLAALDQQASTAMAELAHVTGHEDIAKTARERAGKISAAIEKEYLLPGGGFYAFSRNADGTVDNSPTIFPAVAWWDGNYRLQHAGPMFDRWAAAEFSTDWGTRDLSPTVSFFDPISYHQGTVWPLFTGWTSLAEYRDGRSLAGYAHLMQNADLTWAQDLGSVTELLSGQFFAPLGRSTSHQLWSSAMVISPLLRGLFGLEWDAAGHKLSVSPSLPADWDHAALHKIPLGSDRVDLEMRRSGSMLVVKASGAPAVTLASRSVGAKFAAGELRIPLPAVEAGIPHGLPDPGAATQQLKVLNQQAAERSLTLRLAAPANTHQTLLLRVNDPRVHVRSEGLAASAPEDRASVRRLQVDFGPGEGYVEKTIRFTW